MQTFLCEDNFVTSLEHLDTKRLGKQRVETYQILLALGDTWAWKVYQGSKTFERYGWKNHPVVKMWKGYEYGLRLYYESCLNVWIERGYKNNMPFPDYKGISITYGIIPYWFNDLEIKQKLINSHRSSLLIKNYDFYCKYGWSVDFVETPFYPESIEEYLNASNERKN